MSKQHVADGRTTFDRIGAACDRLQEAGWPEVASALVRDTRQQRGRVSAAVWPARRAAALMRLASEAEALADLAERSRAAGD